MSTVVDRWVDEIEETLFDAADLLPQRELRAGLLGTVHGADFGGYLAERISNYTRETPYEEAIEEETYTLGGKAIERFADDYDEDWRGMTETAAFAAGQFGGMMAPGLMAAVTMNPVFLGGYAMAPAVDALNYLEDGYRDHEVDETAYR